MIDPTQPPDTRWVHPFLRQPAPGPEVSPPARESGGPPRRPLAPPRRPTVAAPRGAVRRAATGTPSAQRRRPAPSGPPNRRWAWLSLAVGVALMTGVQLAEARTTTGTGDFAVEAAPAVASSPVASPVPASSTAASLRPASPTAPLTPATAPATTTPPPSAAAAPAPTPPAAADLSSTPDSTATTGATGSPAPESPAPESPAPVTAGIPLGFALPRLDVQAPIDPVGLTNGELEVPEDITRLGWWTGSAAAGGPSGTTVIDGHIDSPQGRGVFYHLQEVQPDDQVVLTVAGGATVTYRVTERRSYRKADGLPPEVFATSDQPRLVLITCGGRYDFAKASYDDNIVVIAVPA